MLINKKDNFQSFFYCPKCGKKNNENSSTCWKCVFNFSSFQYKDIQNTIEIDKTKKRNKGIILLIVSLILILIIINKAPSIYYDIKGEREINIYDNGSIVEKFTLVKLDGKWLREGNYNSFYLNGGIKEKGTYNNGFKNSEWKTFYNNGKIKNKFYYKRNILEGKYISYYDNGNIDTSMQFSNGLKDGNFYKYDSLNSILIQGQFLNNYEDSLWIYKNDLGVVFKRIFYSNGKIISEDYYDNKGNNCLTKLIGKYQQRNSGIHSNTLITNSYEEVEIYSNKKYFKKRYSYYEDREMALESTNNIRGIVRVTQDSIFFIPKES